MWKLPKHLKFLIKNYFNTTLVNNTFLTAFIMSLFLQNYLDNATKYEAENANLIGVSVGNSVAGFSGTGHTTENSFENPSDKIIFTVNVATAGNYPFVIRYKNSGNIEKYQNIYINGGNNQYTYFPGTTSWANLNFGNISLNAGDNTIEISKSWGWTNIDYIVVEDDNSSGGTQRYEAENANLIGVSSGNSVAGFSGTGHTTANTFNNAGDKIIFNVNVSSTGDYPLVIRYKNIQNQEKYQSIFINGGSNQYTRFPGSASWTNLNFGNVTLNSGNNTIEISKSWGWTHIDYIELGGGTSIPDSDLVTPNPTAETIELWEYLKSVPAQGKILSGIWSQANGHQDIFDNSGKYAAILGFDLWCWHPYGGDVCGRVQQNEVINAAVNHANDGGIVQINWHWGNPLAPSFNMQRNKLNTIVVNLYPSYSDRCTK